jgi:hypothetical protein
LSEKDGRKGPTPVLQIIFQFSQEARKGRRKPSDESEGTRNGVKFVAKTKKLWKKD